MLLYTEMDIYVYGERESCVVQIIRTVAHRDGHIPGIYVYGERVLCGADNNSWKIVNIVKSQLNQNVLISYLILLVIIRYYY